MFRRSLAIVAVVASALTFAPSASAGGGCHWQSELLTQAATTAPEFAAEITGCRYEPTTLFIQPGTKVTWSNRDAVPHTVTGSFLTLNGDELLENGESATVTFEEEGVYAYYCTLHPGMAASVVVGDPFRPAMKSEGSAPTGGSDDRDAGAAGSFSMAAGVAAITTAGLAGAALVVRKRRRALPVPGALR